jgi:ATP-dependent RNA helicase RhlE
MSEQGQPHSPRNNNGPRRRNRNRSRGQGGGQGFQGGQQRQDGESFHSDDRGDDDYQPRANAHLGTQSGVNAFGHRNQNKPVRAPDPTRTSIDLMSDRRGGGGGGGGNRRRRNGGGGGGGNFGGQRSGGYSR